MFVDAQKSTGVITLLHKLYFLKNLFITIIIITFWPHRTACGILVPRPGIEPVLPAPEAWSLNHWTAREFPHKLYF